MNKTFEETPEDDMPTYEELQKEYKEQKEKEAKESKGGDENTPAAA